MWKFGRTETKPEVPVTNMDPASDHSPVVLFLEMRFKPLEKDLEASGCKVQFVSKGTALQYAKRDKPDVLVCAGKNILNGCGDVFRELRRLNPEMSILTMANPDETAKIRGSFNMDHMTLQPETSYSIQTLKFVLSSAGKRWGSAPIH